MNNIEGKSYVLGDNINTDHILVAEYMKYNPSIPEEYEKLGSLAMSGLPTGYTKFIDDNGKSLYPIIIAGENFGCGSSREHAVKALEASGVKIIIAQSFARIFYRNCLNTGKVLLLETKQRLTDNLCTNDDIKVNVEKYKLFKEKTDSEYDLIPLEADVYEIFSIGGIFNYARKKGIL